MLTPTSKISDSPSREACSATRLRIGCGLLRISSFIHRSDSAFRKVLSPIALIAEGSAIGLMRPAEVDRMVRRSYEQQPGFYDPTKYRLPHEDRLIPVLKQRMPAGRLLDAFCGQGREARLFAEAGYDVTAIDHLQNMIDGARKYASDSGFDCQCLVADFHHYLPDSPFDVVYSSVWMYSTIQTSEARQKFLSQCCQCCRPGGLIVLSYISQRHSTADRLRCSVAKAAALVTAGNRETEQGERIYTGLFWHHLPEEQVENEIRLAGLQTVDTLPGEGTAPTFRILQTANEEQV